MSKIIKPILDSGLFESKREISLSQNQVAIIDSYDYDRLSQWNWHVQWSFSAKTYYAIRNGYVDGKRTTIRMHREILPCIHLLEIDHIDGNGLHNWKNNLRIVTRRQNVCNTGKYKNNTTGYKGVIWRKDCGKYEAYLKHYRQRIHIGYFDISVDAALAYDKAAKHYHGEFAQLNFNLG